MFAAGHACVELGRILARDAAFRRYVEAIERRERTIDAVARLYFPDAPKRRAIVARLIVLAVREHGGLEEATPYRRRWALVEGVLVNAAPSAWHDDDTLAPGEPQRMLQDRARFAITHGAQLIARLGAGRCLKCDAQLPERTRRSPSSSERWQRVRYCDACEGSAEFLRESHNGLVRRVIDDVGQSLGMDDAAARRRISRVARQRITPGPRSR